MQAAFFGSVKKKQRKGCVRLMQTKDEGMSREKQYDPENIYRLKGRVPFGKALLLGLQHVLAMYAGNLTPIILITGICGLGDIQVSILQNAMLVAGLITLVQLFTIGPVGAGLPIVMGANSSFIGICGNIAAMTGGGILAYGTILGAGLIGGLFEAVLGFFLKPLRKFFPSVVTGTVVLSIGLSLIPIGINSFAGGSGAGDYGAPINFLVGAIVLIIIVIVKHFTKGIASNSAILIGIVAGYVVCAIFSLFLPTTYIDASGVVQTCSWVLDWSKVADAKWFALPEFLPVSLHFNFSAIFPMCIMFIVSAIETVGDTSGMTVGGLGREATDRELSGSIICDGLGSSLASLFGVTPTTSFSQNVGLITMTRVVNINCISLGALFLVLCGLFPKLAAVISIMPQSVLGGAAVMMFASIVISGIQLITKEKVTGRTITIVSVALGLGYGLGSSTDALNLMPQMIQYLFGGSGIVPAALAALIMNIVLPKDKEVCENQN